MLIIKNALRQLSQEEIGRAEAMCAGRYDGFKYSVRECAMRFGISPAALKKLLPALKRRRRTSAEKQAENDAKAQQRAKRGNRNERHCNTVAGRSTPQEQADPSPATRQSPVPQSNGANAHKEDLQEGNHQQDQPTRPRVPSRPPIKPGPGRLHDWKPGQTAVLDSAFVTVLHHVEPDMTTVQNDYHRQQTVKTERLQKPADHLAQAS